LSSGVRPSTTTRVVSRESAAKEGQRKLNGLVAALRRQGIEVDGVCIPGEPIEAILGQAARWEADVIAVDAQSRRGLSRWVLGSIAEGVLRRAGCPVLVVKHASPFVHACRRGDRRQVIS